MSNLTFFFEPGSSYMPMNQDITMQEAFLVGLGMLIGYIIPKIVAGDLSFDQSQILEWIISGLQKYLLNADSYIMKLAKMVSLENVQYIVEQDFGFVMQVLGWLGPFIDTHNSVVMLLTALVNLLKSYDSPLFETLNHLCNRMKGNGVVLMEYYRAFENLVGIQISDSRFPLQD